MTTAQHVISWIVRTLPRSVRERYREEWQADLEGAEELGLSRSSVVRGALAIALTIHRADPRLSGVPRGRVAESRVRWALAFLATAGVLTFALALWEGRLAESGLTDSVPGWILVGGHRVLIIVAASAGLIASVGIITAVGVRKATTAVWGSLVLLGYLLLTAAMVIIPMVGFLYAAGGIMGAITMIMIDQPPRRDATPTPDPARARSRLLLGIGYAGVSIVTLVISVLHSMVWDPLAQVPGMTLAEIRSTMEAAQELPPLAPVIGWGAIWVAATVAFLVVCARGRAGWSRTRRGVVSLGSLLVAGVAITGWFAGFGMGMGLGDTFATLGPGAASGPLLGTVGALALMTALLCGFGATPSPGPQRISPPGPASGGHDSEPAGSGGTNI